MDLHANHRKRMRERIAATGLDGLQPHEVLEYLLYAYVPRKDTNAIAHELIRRFGSLSGVLDSDPTVLAQVPNMTENAALFLASLPAVSKRYRLDKLGERPLLATREQLRAYVLPLLENDNEEHIFMLGVDNGGRLISRCELGVGGTEECQLLTRKLVLQCHNLSSPNLYLVHNHPSGVAEPSVKDIEFTKWAAASLEMLGILLIDHLIVARGQLYSFLYDGQLQEYRNRYYDFMQNTDISDRL